MHSIDKRFEAIEERLYHLEKDYYDLEEIVHLPRWKREKLIKRFKKDLKKYEKQKPTGWTHAIFLHNKVPRLKELIKKAEKDELTDVDLEGFQRNH